MQYRRKTVKPEDCETLEKIPFTDDCMFRMVLHDPEICRELLERILPHEQFSQVHLADPDGTFSDRGAKNTQSGSDTPRRGESEDAAPAPVDPLSLLTTQIQAALKFGSDSRGVRFDAYAKSEDVWAEIEMQVHTGEHLGKRSRYYSANMDIDMLMAGTDYKKLKRTYVIFICTYDYMKQGNPVYFFQHYDTENQLPLGDEQFIMILTTRCDAAKVPENLKALYAYINDPKNASDDALIAKIDNRVRQYSGSNWRWMQVTFEEHVKHMAYLAREEGIEEGREEAMKEIEQKLEEAMKESAQKLKDEKLSIAAKLKATGMTREEITEITGLGLEEISSVGSNRGLLVSSPD